ncbi:reverse transcriptase domain-containing protein, partial [Tanacetum coccineum]
YYHFHEDHGHETNDYRQLRNQIEEAVNSGQLFHLVKGIKKERVKDSENQRTEGKKDKSTTPAKAPILMIRQDESYMKNKSKSLNFEGKEITFPSEDSNSSAPIVIKAKIFEREVNRVHMDGGSSCERMGIIVSTIHGAIKFHTAEWIGIVFSTHESDKVKEGVKKVKETPRQLKKEFSSVPRQNKKWSLTTSISNKQSLSESSYRNTPTEGKPFNTEHKLNEYNHVKPIKQKRRGLGPDRSTTACKEVEELMKAGILRKVKHQTWVANPVMVKKSEGGWRMWFRLKCFLDAYKGYHRIQMAEGDEDKTSFFVGEGVFCYRKMPFGLKNAGATHQRLVEKVFHDQIGRNLEAYVDDMVIKSTSEEEMLTDIKETFEKFRSINMKLNPKKCSFGVEEVPFLGHLITKQGIRANPSKVKAITNVGQLKTLKDVHSLNGKIAALSRFVSKGAERSFPFFKVLKSCTNKKNIQWTQEAEAALQEMKKFIEILPTLMAPVQEDILIIYLTASTESISVALFAKREEDQQGGYEGLMLIDPEGKEYTCALRFRFETTNNEAEYEALLVGLRISQEMEITSLAIFVDSQLLVNQIKGTYEAKQPTIKEYLQKTKEALKGFDSYTIEHIRRNQNKKPDALSKLASMTFEHLTKEVLVEVLLKRSIEGKEILQDPKESRKIKVNAPQYKCLGRKPDQRSFYTLWLCCVALPQTDDIVKDVHKGSCGFNTEPRSIVVRIIKYGYYWPSMHRDATKVLQDCEKCKDRRALHEMGGSKTSDRYKRKACRKIRMGISSVKIRRATNNQIEGREAFQRRTLPRNSQKETPFSLTYGSEAIIPMFENDVAKDNREKIKEVDKRRENKEIASIEEAYYRSKLRSLEDIMKWVATLHLNIDK